MRKLGIIGLGAIAIAVQSCAPQQEEVKPLEEQSLEELRSYRSTIKDSIMQFTTLVNDIDSFIAIADTSKVKTTPVTIDTVASKTFEHFFEVHGNVEVENNAALFAEAPGTIKKIHVKEGQSVKKGDLIISLDAGPMESGIKELEKGYELAKTVYEKQSKLWEQKIGSEIQYLEAKTNKESLQQKLKTMNEQLDMYKIRAPFAGTVDDIIGKVGEAAAPGFPVARVLNLDKIYLESTVSEKYLGSVKEGGYVEVNFPSVGETVSAKITRTGNFINPANRTFTVRVELSNPGGKYKPNQLAVMKIRDFKADDALVVPSKIIQQDRKGQDYIFTVVKNDNGLDVVKRLDLTVNDQLSYKGETMILTGVSAKQIFIDKGAKSVQEGNAVEIVTE